MEKSFKDIAINRIQIPHDVYARAEALAKEKHILLVHALIRLSAAEPRLLLKAYAHSFNLNIADLDAMDIPANVINLIPADVAKKSRVIPIDRVGNNIIIALENPNDLKVIDFIRFKTGFTTKTVLCGEDQINSALQKYYPVQSMDINKLSQKGASNLKSKDKAAQRATITEGVNDESGPVIDIVNQILLACVSRGASDIHIEPYETFLRVRLRIDGTLHEIARPPAQYKLPISSRFKIMASLNIAEKRLPQDGSISVKIANKPIDFRVNTLPTMFGEKIVLRILDKSSLNVDLTKLGFEQRDFDRFTKGIHKPFGMVLVTGPTGSGKTTTLYSALADLNKTSDNIITAEDPVEFTIDGINQVQISIHKDMTFAKALRAFLRQDPDTIMVGEIRDLETGEIAIKAALTGHLVLSTLHTNSAVDTIIRLQNMGIKSFNLVSALNIIVAQRLAKKICEHCRIVDEKVTTSTLIEVGIPPDLASRAKAYKGQGCSKCSQSGSKGRVAIHEVMTITDEIRNAIMKGESAMELKRVAMEGGMLTLRQNALNKMLRGEITIIEVVKTTSADSGEAVEESA